jgi:predicted CopG family antitoxin
MNDILVDDEVYEYLMTRKIKDKAKTVNAVLRTILEGAKLLGQ